MNEEQWLACDSAEELLFSGHTSPRKLHLFACACCRRVWRFVTDERVRAAFAVVERFIEGRATQEELREAGSVTEHGASDWGEVYRAMELVRYTAHGSRFGSALRASRRAAWAVGHETDPTGESLYEPRYRNSPAKRAMDREFAAQACLIRDIRGNPFRPVAFSPDWRTSDVMLLANGIYAERAFDRMPILADALQDAGCDSDDILNHLRDTTATHVRGCWALDLVLGKE